MGNKYFEELDRHLKSELTFNDLYLTTPIGDDANNRLIVALDNGHITEKEFRQIKLHKKSTLIVERLMSLVVSALEQESQELKKLRNLGKRKKHFNATANSLSKLWKSTFVTEHLAKATDEKLAGITKRVNPKSIEAAIDDELTTRRAITFLNYVRSKGEIKTEEDAAKAIVFYLWMASQNNTNKQPQSIPKVTEDELNTLIIYCFVVFAEEKIHNYISLLPKTWGVSVKNIIENEKVQIVEPKFVLNTGLHDEIRLTLIEVMKKYVITKDHSLVDDFFKGLGINRKISVRGKRQQLYDFFKKLKERELLTLTAIEIGELVAKNFRMYDEPQGKTLNPSTIRTFINRKEPYYSSYPELLALFSDL